MKVELTIDCSKELPKGAVPALEKELSKRLQNQFDECSLVIRRAGSHGLSVYGREKEAKKMVEEILQQTWKAQTTGIIETACNNFPVWRGLVKQKEELPSKGYAVIRCHDGVIVARLHSFPECDSCF